MAIQPWSILVPSVYPKKVREDAIRIGIGNIANKIFQLIKGQEGNQGELWAINVKVASRNRLGVV